MTSSQFTYVFHLGLFSLADGGVHLIPIIHLRKVPCGHYSALSSSLVKSWTLFFVSGR